MSDQAEAKRSRHADDESPFQARLVAIALRVSQAVPQPVRNVVRFAVEQGEQPRSVRELAAAVGMPRKSMDRRLAETITVSARQLLGWGRLIALSMHLSADSKRSIAAIAGDMEFASPSALRNILQRYAGLTPTELRRRGTEHMVQQLLNRLRG